MKEYVPNPNWRENNEIDPKDDTRSDIDKKCGVWRHTKTGVAYARWVLSIKTDQHGQPDKEETANHIREVATNAIAEFLAMFKETSNEEILCMLENPGDKVSFTIRRYGFGNNENEAANEHGE